MRFCTRFRWLAAGASLTAIPMTTAVAVAQERPAVAADGNDDDIIVTASRRDERVQDVAGQVGAVGGDTLDLFKARGLADFAALTPGVSFQSTSPGSNRIVIRGVTTGGSQQSSAIGLYVDDVPIGSSTQFGQGAQALNLGLFDLDRVEVLNGPQGTLYGSNALGGTLKYITRAPDPSAIAGRVEGEGGVVEHGAGSWGARAALNVPVSADVAVRATGVAEQNAGFVDDPAQGLRHQGGSKTLAGRISLSAAVTPDLDVRLTALAQRISNDGYATVFRDPVTHAPVGGLYEQSNRLPESGRGSLALFSGVVNWNLGAAKLTSVTAFQNNILNAVSDESVTYGAIVTGLFGPVAGSAPFRLSTHVRTKRFTQELRLASPDGGTLEWVVGGFFSRETTRQRTGLTNAADANGYLFGFPIGDFDIPSVQREFALFGDATVHLSPTFDATVGIRQSWDKLDYTQSASGLGNNPANPFVPVVSRARSDESTTTWLFNARYRPTRETTLYARVASGFRPGGPNIVFGAGSGNASFAPDRLWNYELGARQGFDGGRGLVTLSAYQIDWSDIQLAVNVGGVTQFANSGDARIRGLEFSTSWRAAKGLNVVLSGAYTVAKLTTPSPALGVTYSGARLPLSPKLSLALAANYRADLGGGISADLNASVRHVGERQAGYVGSAVVPLYRLDAYQTVDLGADVDLPGGWRVGPYVRNLFDVRGEVSAATFANTYVPGAPVPVTLSQPRTFAIVFGKAF